MPMKHWPRSLLWQLCLALIGIQCIALAGFGWYISHRVADHHRAQTIRSLERLNPFVVDRVRPMIEGSAEIDLQRAATDVIDQDGLRITIIDPAGVVIADTMQAPAAMDNHLARPEVVRALADGVGTSVRYSTSVFDDMVYLARRVDTPGGESYIVRTALVLAQADAGLTSMIRWLVAVIVVVLILTAGLFYLVSRRMTRSVRTLAAQADAAIAASAPNPVTDPGVRELSPIAASINHLSTRLRDRINELSRRQREHDGILESMSSGIVALDADQRILRMNKVAARFFDADVERVRNRPLHEVIRHPDVHQHVDHAMEVVDGDVGTTELQTYGATPRMIEVMSTRIADDTDNGGKLAGRSGGLLLVMNDVTALRRLESVRSDFAANVSHELRTPITNIKGYIDTLLDVGSRDEQQHRAFLEVIRRNADRLGAIIEDILSLAWLEQPDTPDTLQPDVVDARLLLESVAAQFKESADAKRIALCIVAPENMALTVNRQLMEQALANYVSNAIKYSSAETTVTLRAARCASVSAGRAPEIELAVTDEGPGINANHQARIFERFYRVDKARSRELGGTGLGLAIVKHIALVHGGRVEVDSTVGQGSTFRIVLPEHPEPAERRD